MNDKEKFHLIFPFVVRNNSDEFAISSTLKREVIREEFLEIKENTVASYYWNAFPHG
ncbi:MAG: hypothetical protein AB2L18_00230 [Anaerolineaceae bacterium]